MMQAAFKRDFDIDYAGADPKLRLGYAKGFVAGKKKPMVDFDPTIAAGNKKPMVDFDPTIAATVKPCAMRETSEQCTFSRICVRISNETYFRKYAAHLDVPLSRAGYGPFIQEK